MRPDLAKRLLVVIAEMRTNPAIGDVLWMPGNAHVTLAEELADVASELGATEDEIESLFEMNQ